MESARDLGIIIDSQLLMEAHAASLCRNCCYQLRQLRLVTRSFSTAAAVTVVHIFIASRLDCYDSLLWYMSIEYLMKSTYQTYMLRSNSSE